MATGDSPSFINRLRDLLPRGWFGSFAPIRDAILGGLADDLAAQFTLLKAVLASSRLKTTTGWLLDLAAYDFFGPLLVRLPSETDDHLRSRIVAEVFRERVTRAGIVKALTDLTGRTPAVFDPVRPLDTGGYGISRMGYGRAGAYGSLSRPNEIFITAFRSRQSAGLPNVNGYGGFLGGYGVGRSVYATASDVQGVITDDAILDLINRVVASGVKANCSISD